MKNLIVFILGLCVAGLFLGCEESQNGRGLSISVSGIGTVNPAGTATDCNFNEVGAPRFHISGLTMEWSRTEYDLVINYLKIEIQSDNVSGGNVILSDSDLDGLLAYADGNSAVTIRDGVVPQAPAEDSPRLIANAPGCRLYVEGFTITDESRNFRTRYELEVSATARGITQENSGEEIPIRISTRGQLIYDLN